MFEIDGDARAPEVAVRPAERRIHPEQRNRSCGKQQRAAGGLGREELLQRTDEDTDRGGAWFSHP